MIGQTPVHISAPMVQAIEDAILLGNIREVDGVLDLIREEPDFPADLRYALESLLYFRIHYGKGGMLEPIDNDILQDVIRMERVWGREIIETIAPEPDMTETKYA